MVRAQETAQGIAEVLDLPIETDADLHEVRQSDAYYASSPDYGDTATLNWMPTATADYAQPGAESFDQLVARVKRVQERLARGRGAADPGGQPLRLPALLPRLHDVRRRLRAASTCCRSTSRGHANTGITIFERRTHRVMDGIDLPGWILTTWNDQAHL